MKKISNTALSTCSAFLSMLLFLTGLVTGNYNLLYVAVLVIFSGNIFFALLDICERIVFLCFNATMFLFLVGRPLASVLMGREWWGYLVTDEASHFAVSAVYVSLLSLYFFTAPADTGTHSSLKIRPPGERPAFVKNLEFVSLLIFIVSIACTYVEGIERISFMRSHTYLENYLGVYTTSLPFVVKGVIQLHKPAMCVFLATFPEKKKAFWVLGAYLISTLPYLIVGSRGSTMLACIFIVVYYVLRDSLRSEKEPKWFGYAEKSLIIACVPFVLFFLVVYNDLRNGNAVSQSRMTNPLTSFFYDQGMTFLVVERYQDYKEQLPDVGYAGFTFGYAFDQFWANGLVSRFFGITVPQGQSQEFLDYTRDLCHHLSYAVLGDEYFKGNGLGTSYIIDIFADYGWVGLIAFNAFIAYYMANIKKFLCRSWLSATIVMHSLLLLFFIPRDRPLNPWVFLLSPYFWAGILICCAAAMLITPRYVLYSTTNEKDSPVKESNI